MPIEIGPYASGEIGPGLAPYIGIIGDVFDSFGYDGRITHIRDGKHSVSSLHYIGDALDIIWLPYKALPNRKAAKIKEELYRKLNGFPKKAGLRGNYDVIYENSHFHIEYQPKMDEVRYRAQVEKYLKRG